MTAILLIAPLLRHFSENSVIDALTGLAVWGILWVIFVIMAIFLLVCIASQFFPESVKVEGLEGAQKMLKPFAKLKWWKSLISYSAVIGVFIYVDWSGPAVLYTINSAGMWAAIVLMRKTILKVCEKLGIEFPETVTETTPADDLKKSIL